MESAAAQAARSQERLDAAEQAARDAQPLAEQELRALLALLDLPGVSDALLAGPAADVVDAPAECAEEATSSGARPRSDASTVLPVVEEALRGRRTYEVKTLRQRYDATRAGLAGTWTLDPGDTHGGLDTFVLTHDSHAFTPPAAARRAEQLRERARAALDAAEESALRDFVIGRLPSAVGTAWTRLHDWVADVNVKIRSAEASSGVGVRVRARLRPDLPAAVQTVHDLACRVSDADRTTEQKQQIGDALRRLIAAADGQSMMERVAAAVDVREWVDVFYEVARPDGSLQRWTSRTGLSGGERRLVVLAPMLAAVAAAYERLGSTGLRLCGLDEVPAEVDERGREGLARFVAELDLDLVCTSYLWDGAPGAWDGIDAHDLEAAGDGTVVAFPMLIRGLEPLPGEELLAPTQPPRP